MMNDGGNGLHDSLSQLSLDNESPPLQPRHLASAAPSTPRTATTQVFAQARPLRTPPTSAATATNLSPQHPQSLKRSSISDLDDSWAAEMDLEEIVASHRKKARDGTPVTTAERPEPVALPISAQQSFSYDFSESSDSEQWLTDAEKESSFHEKFHFISQRKLTAHRKFFLQNKIRSAKKQTTTMTPESKSSPRNIVSTDHDFDDELSFLSPSKTAPTVKLLSQNAEIEAAIHKLFEINRDFVDQGGGGGATTQISLSQSSTSSSTSSVLSSSQSSTSSSSSSSSTSASAPLPSLHNHRQYRAHVTAATTTAGRLYGKISLKTVYTLPTDRSTRLDRRFGDRLLRMTFNTALPHKDDDRWSSPSSQQISAYKLLIAEIITQPLFIAGNMYIPLIHKNSIMYFFAIEGNNLIYIDINNARNFMGQFHLITNPAKCNIRMNLSLSQTYNTLCTKDIHIIIEDDIMSDNSRQYMMTDGCGLMSEDISERIWKMLPRPFHQRCPNIPSHLQMRLFSHHGTFKGMLMTDIHCPPNTIRLRKSQLKCGAPTYVDEEFLTIDVVDVARRPFHKIIQDAAQQCIQQPLTKDMTTTTSPSVYTMTDINDTTELVPTARLNRQIIAMLSSRGVTNMIFFKLLEDALNDINLCNYNYINAIKLLHLSINDDNNIYEDFQIQLAIMLMCGHTLDEAHIQHVLNLLKSRELDHLLSKTAIPCPKAAYLYALPDSNQRILNEGEVFVKMNGSVLRHCYVVCGRLPCLRRDALRVLRCVDCPHLSHIDNAIVFSCRGAMSELEKMSGDYDGDRVLVIWNEQIVDSIRRTDVLNSKSLNRNDHVDGAELSTISSSQAVVKPSPNRKLQFGKATAETTTDAVISSSSNHIPVGSLPPILYIQRHIPLPTLVEDEYLRYEFAHLFFISSLYEFQHALGSLSYAHLALVCDPSYGPDHTYTRQVADLFDRAVNAEKTGEYVSLPTHISRIIRYPFWIKGSYDSNNYTNIHNNDHHNNNIGNNDYFRFAQHIITLLNERIQTARTTKPDKPFIIDPETTYDHTRYKTNEDKLLFENDIELAREAYELYNKNNRIYMQNLAENDEKNWSNNNNNNNNNNTEAAVGVATGINDLPPHNIITPATTMSFRQRMEEHRKLFLSSIIKRYPHAQHMLTTDVLIDWWYYHQLEPCIKEDMKRLASAYYLHTYTTERARHAASQSINNSNNNHVSGHRLWFIWSVCPMPLNDIKLRKGDREGQTPAPPPIMMVMARDRAPLFLSKFTHATSNKLDLSNNK